MLVFYSSAEPVGAEVFFGWSLSRFKILAGAGSNILDRLRLLFLQVKNEMI